MTINNIWQKRFSQNMHLFPYVTIITFTNRFSHAIAFILGSSFITYLTVYCYLARIHLVISVTSPLCDLPHCTQISCQNKEVSCWACTCSFHPACCSLSWHLSLADTYLRQQRNYLQQYYTNQIMIRKSSFHKHWFTFDNWFTQILCNNKMVYCWLTAIAH